MSNQRIDIVQAYPVSPTGNTPDKNSKLLKMEQEVNMNLDMSDDNRYFEDMTSYSPTKLDQSDEGIMDMNGSFFNQVS